MNWSALTKKQQQLAIVTVVLAVAQIILMAQFLGWTKPASARGGSVKKELIEFEGKLNEARTTISRAEAVRSELTKGVAKLEELTVYAPTISDRYAWAYEYVSRCATQTKINLDSLDENLSLDDVKKAADQPYEISISTRCGYSSLVEFLYRLEKGNPLLRIKEVKVSALPEQPQSHQVHIVIQWPASVKIEKGAQ